MNEFVIRIILLAVSIYLVGKLTKLFIVEDFQTAIISALLLAVVNALVRPIIIFLTLPITILTLGLFLLFINGLSLLIVSKLVPKFNINGCATAAVAAILISITNMILEWLVN
ncbi:phage holin family protein [Candidatus Cloacimonadota bacterium]